MRAQVGDVLSATVMDVKDYGAIVEVLRGRVGLIHISELAHTAPASTAAAAELLQVLC